MNPPRRPADRPGPPVAAAVIAASLSLALTPPASFAELVHSASLRDGDYGAGTLIDTMPPDHGGAPHAPGVADSPDGVTYTATETDGRSNGLINYELGAHRTSFLASGTVAVRIHAHRDTHATGSIFGDNNGFDTYHNGQGNCEVRIYRVPYEEGPDDDRIRIVWSVLHPTYVWYYPVNAVELDYDTTYELGFAWGGPDQQFELWVDGELAAGFDFPDGKTLPWGPGLAATNFGIGDNHERGYDVYGSGPGITLSDLRIWDEYRAFGDTTPPPSPGDPPFKQQLALHFDAGQGTFSDTAGTLPANPGDPVNRWLDLGPLNGDNAAVGGFYHGGGSWNPPVLGEAGIPDGLNRPIRTIRFNGANGFVAEMTGEGAPGLNDQQLTTVVVARIDGDLAGPFCGGRYGALDTGWGGAFGMAWFTGWSTSGGYYGAARTSSATEFSVSGSDPTGIFVVQSFVNHGYGGDHWQSFLDSSTGLEEFHDAGPPVTLALRDLRADPTYPSPYFTALAVGRSDTSDGPYLKGDIAELLVYDGVLAPGDLAQVVDHLAVKYFDVGLPSLEIARTPTGVELSWDAFERFLYRVQRSTDRMESWEVISGDLNGMTGERLVHPQPSPEPPTFFRVEAIAPGGPPG